MDYFLMSRTEWHFPVQDFPQWLLSRWPTSSLKEDAHPGSNHRFDFQLPMVHSTLHGALNREGNALIFFADLRDCADFVLWWRAQAPETVQLFLCDEGVNVSLDVLVDTTPKDILDAMGYEQGS